VELAGPNGEHFRHPAWEISPEFAEALNRLRDSMALRILGIANHYKLVVEDELASILEFIPVDGEP
jgi:hypothetical protein